MSGARQHCCGTAATTTVCSSLQAWTGLKVLNMVKKGEKKETLHIPLHSPFREMFKAYFGLNAHGLYFPYCALTCFVESLFVPVPDSPTGSDTKSVKTCESLQEPLEVWKLVQRAGRWQSMVSSPSPNANSEHGASYSQKCQVMSLCHFQIVPFTEKPCLGFVGSRVLQLFFLVTFYRLRRRISTV